MVEKKVSQEEYRQAQEAIAKHIAAAQESLHLATEISDATGVSFGWDIDVYDMGGWYNPNDGWEASARSC